MLAVEIRTSRPGVLWPSEHWKTLIDSLARGGAKWDPRQKYRDLAGWLDFLIEERRGRFLPRHGMLLHGLDDAAVRVIVVRRVPAGSEMLILGEAEVPQSSCWTVVQVPFLGTIGACQPEAQSRANAIKLSDVLSGRLVSKSSRLALCFGLDANRRDRDVDNLADPLMAVFQSHLMKLDEVCIAKLDSTPSDHEEVRFSVNHGPITVRPPRG